MPRDPSRPALTLPDATPLAAPEDFVARLAELGVTLSSAQVEGLGAYLARLLAMNEHMNLTRITDPAEAWTRHVLDSLTLLPHMKDAGGRLIDVGSGGGVPGIPLAIARPDLAVTLLDATEKKVAFLSAVAASLALSNVKAIAGRAEKLAAKELKGGFDVVTARAVARLVELIPWTVPFARRGGRILLIKGERAEEELAEAGSVLKRYRCTHERTVQTATGRVVILRAG